MLPVSVQTFYATSVDMQKVRAIVEKGHEGYSRTAQVTDDDKAVVLNVIDHLSQELIKFDCRAALASSRKIARAEPVAALFESGRAAFAGTFPALEDELAGLVQGGGYQGPSRSPDRADACVWALTELMLGKAKKPRVWGP